jgi:hypothetical protein
MAPHETHYFREVAAKERLAPSDVENENAPELARELLDLSECQLVTTLVEICGEGAKRAGEVAMEGRE